MNNNRNDNQSRYSDDIFAKKSEDNKLDNNIRTRFRSNYKPEIDQSRVKYVDGFIKSTKPSERIQPRDLDNVTFKSEQSDNADNFFSQGIDNRNDGFKIKKSRKDRKKLFSKKKKPGKLKIVMRTFSFLIVTAVLGAGSILGYGYLKSRNVFNGDGTGAVALQKDVDPSKLNGEGDGRVNILMLGKGGPGHEAPDLTDTILLASIDPIANEASLISVPRDLYVEDRNGYSTKINAIYSGAKQAMLAKANKTDEDKEAAENAGLTAIENSVTEVLGVPIHYNVMVDFTAFKDAIDTIGGITIDVKEPLYDSSLAWLLKGNPLVAAKGLQTFDGSRALLYARSRHGSARGDFDRAERQREVLVALQQKMMSAGTFSNPFKVVELLDNFGDHVRTDLNGLGEIKRLYEISQNIGSDKVTSLGLADPPNVLVATDNIGGLSVVVPTAGLNQYDEIRSYIRNTIRDPFLKRENARVIILNGTGTAGLATATSEELKSYGYNVVSVDNAPTSDYTKSQLIDISNGTKEYTKSYIQKRLGLTSTSNAPVGIPGTDVADFVIILGTDEITENSN